MTLTGLAFSHNPFLHAEQHNVASFNLDLWCRSGNHLREPPRTLSQLSGPIDFEAAAHGGSDCLQVVLVGTDHQVMPTEGPFNYARVHDVASRGVSSERADRAGLTVTERFDVTPGQQPGQQSLAAPATPGLR